MINPVTCEFCGSARLRRSRRRSKSELLTMLIGTYPFRCLDCNGRFSVNVFLLSTLAFARCRKCLGLNLTTWERRAYHVSPLKKLMLSFGGRRYRCPSCRYNFVSFRPVVTRPATTDPSAQRTPDSASQAELTQNARATNEVA
jgi:transposase-like protein